MKLDQEVDVHKPVSKDHLRTNRLGIRLEQLESLDRSPLSKNRFYQDRMSLDATTSFLNKKKLDTTKRSFHNRNMSHAQDLHSTLRHDVTL